MVCDFILSIPKGSDFYDCINLFLGTILEGLLDPPTAFHNIFSLIGIDGPIEIILSTLLSIYGYGYQLYYLIDKFIQRSKRNNANSDKKNIKPINKIFFAIYILSFLSYLFLTYYGVFGTSVGFALFGGNSYEYGFGAMSWEFIIFSIIPIYPLIILFQLIYSIKNYKRFTARHKKITKFTIGIVVSLLYLAAVIPMIVDYQRKQEKAHDIEVYLTNKYGSGDFEYDIDTESIKTSYMNSTFGYDDFHNTDGFIDVYYKEKNGIKDLDKYLENTMDSTIQSTISNNFDVNVYADYNLNLNKNYGHVPSLQELLSNIEVTDLRLTINKEFNSEEELIDYIKELTVVIIDEGYRDIDDSIYFEYGCTKLNFTTENGKIGYVGNMDNDFFIYMFGHRLTFDLEELLNK